MKGKNSVIPFALWKLNISTPFTFPLLFGRTSHESEHTVSVSSRLWRCDSTSHRRPWQTEVLMILAFSQQVERWSGSRAVSRRNQWERLREIHGVVRFQWGQMHDRKVCSRSSGVLRTNMNWQKTIDTENRRSLSYDSDRLLLKDTRRTYSWYKQ